MSRAYPPLLEITAAGPRDIELEQDLWKSVSSEALLSRFSNVPATSIQGIIYAN